MYDSGYNEDDVGYDICRSTDGINFYVVGTTFVPGTGFCISAMKINPFGVILWSKIIGIDSERTSIALSVAPTPDGGCIFTGDWDEPFTMKLNPDGITGWFKQYSAPDYYAHLFHIEPTSDGGYIACGRSHLVAAYILKVNSTGDLQWQRDVYYGYFKAYYWVTEAIGGGYLTLSDSLVGTPNNYKPEITKWDVNGDVVWKKIYTGDFGYPTVIRRINNGYVLFGVTIDTVNDTTSTLFFSKLDINGNRFTDKIVRGNKGEYFTAGNVINDNRYILASYSATPFISDTVFTYLRITDSLGYLLHQKTMFVDTVDPNGYYINSITTAINGDIVIGGFAEIVNHTNSDVFAMRSDSNLIMSSIGIQLIGSNVPLKFNLYQNYPNPFNPITKIKFDISSNQVNVKLVIYDILGRVIKVIVNGELKGGTYEASFNAASLSSGIYYYKLTASDFTKAMKMILIK